MIGGLAAAPERLTNLELTLLCLLGDAFKLHDIREALRAGDVKRASQLMTTRANHVPVPVKAELDYFARFMFRVLSFVTHVPMRFSVRPYDNRLLPENEDDKRKLEDLGTDRVDGPFMRTFGYPLRRAQRNQAIRGPRAILSAEKVGACFEKLLQIRDPEFRCSLVDTRLHLARIYAMVETTSEER